MDTSGVLAIIENMQVSATIISYNEEKNIRRCIFSLKKVADEILVVDSYSTDATVSIAKKLGARIIKRKFTNYVDQKNFASKHVTYPWILNLDADEALSPELRKSVLQKKKDSQNMHSPIAGYKFPRLTRYCGRWIYHCGWYPNIRIRLYDRRFAKWHGKLIHEQIIVDSDKQVACLKGDLLHYTMESLSEHVEQINRYSTIAAHALTKSKKSPNFWLDVIGNPIFTFLQKYLFRLGFLDGVQGLFICTLSAHANFLKYAKAWQTSKKRKK